MQGVAKQERLCESFTLVSCKTIADVIRVHKRYKRIPTDINQLVIDMSPLCRMRPDPMLLGVLLNIRRHFGVSVEIYLSGCPRFLPILLAICHCENLFIVADGSKALEKIEVA